MPQSGPMLSSAVECSGGGNRRSVPGLIPGFNHLRFQIHFKRNARVGLCTSLNSSSICSSLRGHRQLVIEAVAVKDIIKSRITIQSRTGRAHGVLSRGGAAAEVFPRQQYRCPGTQENSAELRVRLLTFIVEKAPVVKQVRAKAGAGDLLQKFV